MSKLTLTIRQTVRRVTWSARHTCRRYATAWRYARRRSTLTDGYNLLHDAERIVGIYSLESLSVQSTTDLAVDRYGEEHRDALEELTERACDRVVSKWNSSGEAVNAAEGWACDLVAEYAAEQGLKLTDSWSLAA